VDSKGLALLRIYVVNFFFFFLKKNEKPKGVALLMTCLVGEGTRMYVEALVGKGYEKEESNFD
jgi:transcriptional regulatory protein LevR